MSTFVHNEPSSLAVLQEVGLPEVFYDAVESGLDPAFEVSIFLGICPTEPSLTLGLQVLQAIPNAIGALCLNQAGQDLLTNRTKTIPTLFSVFTSERHAKMLHEKENAALLGNAFDELIRHHPNLKDAVFEAVAATLVKIEEFGSTYTDPNGLASPFKLQLVPHMLRPSDHSDLLQHQAMEYGQPRPPTPIPMQTEEDEALRTPASEAEAVDSVPRASVDVTENLVVLFVDVLGRVRIVVVCLTVLSHLHHLSSSRASSSTRSTVANSLATQTVWSDSRACLPSHASHPKSAAPTTSRRSSTPSPRSLQRRCCRSSPSRSVIHSRRLRTCGKR